MEEGIENTIEAFRRGFVLGAEEVETDLQITMDGVICVRHDLIISIQGQKRRIDDIDYNELKRTKSDSCTLEDVLANFPEKNFIFEIKSESNYTKLIDALWETRPDIFSKHKFISFSAAALQYIKKINSGAYCSYIGTSNGNDGRTEYFITKRHMRLCVAKGFEELSGHWFTYTRNKILLAHSMGLRVGIGPVNTKRLFHRCMRNGVDSIYTDHIRKIVSLNKPS